jgi:hypothetical protein
MFTRWSHFRGLGSKSVFGRSAQKTKPIQKLTAAWLQKEMRNVETWARSNYSNEAELRELMTAPPMKAEQHAAITRKRIECRRMLEDAKEQRMASSELF